MRAETGFWSLYERAIHGVMQELEDILDDDQDMTDMYIGRRADQSEQKAHRQASLASTWDDDHSDHGEFDHPAPSSLPGEHVHHPPFPPPSPSQSLTLQGMYMESLIIQRPLLCQVSMCSPPPPPPSSSPFKV